MGFLQWLRVRGGSAARQSRELFAGYDREEISPPVGQATTPAAVDSHGEIASGMCENARPVDWNDLKYLLALKRAGTLAGAARALSVDHSTVSRRLVALEEAIGSQLLQRRGGDGRCGSGSTQQAGRRR